MKVYATVRVGFDSEKLLKVVLDALAPETRKALSRRSRVTIRREGTSLLLVVEAWDTVALRAALNSYLHWVMLATDAYNAVAPAPAGHV